MKSVAQRLAWALEVCRRARMRPTPVREKILSFLAGRRIPVSLETVAQADGIQGFCNEATVYRTLMLLQELEITRPVSLPNKISYFVLNLPGENSHFLICRRCGQITDLPGADSVAVAEREVFTASGYAPLYHEVEFFGICPTCQKQPSPMLSAKLQSRSCSAKPSLLR